MSFRNTLILILFLEAGVGVLGMGNYGWTIEGLQAVTRFSGRLSLIIFSFIFLFHHHPHIKLKGFLSGQYFMLFAIAHGIHLIELLSFLYLSGLASPERFAKASTQPILYRLAGGFLAYLLIFVMPVLQNRFEGGRIAEPGFNQLSLVYLYYVWFIFFMTYLPRVRGTLEGVGGSYQESVVLLGWVSLLLGIKLSQLFSKRITRERSS